MNWFKRLFCAHYWIHYRGPVTRRIWVEGQAKREPFQCVRCGKMRYEHQSWIPFNYIGE